MSKELSLHPDVIHQIKKIERTEIIVGLCTLNHSRSIGHVLKVIRTGLDDCFPSLESIVVLADGGSSDPTISVTRDAFPSDRLIVFSHTRHPVYQATHPDHELLDKAHCQSAILEITKNLEAKACFLVDPDNEGLTPEWVDLMIKPVVNEGFDFVAPTYQRHKYDGTLTNNLIYPLMRTLYGQRIRQPLGQDMALSHKMALNFLNKDLWHTKILAYCPELWMTTVATAEGFRVCQSLLGPKTQRTRSYGTDLSLLLTKIVGSMFDLMESYQTVWIGINGSEPSPIFGLPQDLAVEPVKVNTDRMIKAFNQGVSDLSGVWQEFLSKEVLRDLKRLASVASGDFHFQDSLWARTVMEFAVAYSRSRFDRSHVLKSMTPLYLGRTASFITEIINSTAAEVENRIELLCLEFEALKPYLVERWKS